MTARRRAIARVSRVAQAEAPAVVRVAPVAVERPIAPLAIPATRLELTEAGRIAFLRAQRETPVPAEESAALEGHLSQRCPDCGRAESAHFYCSYCYLPMGLADWYRETDSEAQRAAKQARTRKSAADAPTAAKPRNFGVLAGPGGLLTLGF